jgi:hypothetical protein
MEKNRRVCLFGKSILLSTVGLSLQSFPDLEIIHLSLPLPDTLDLVALAPDVIIFDIQTSHQDSIFPLLTTLPNLMLIGIDPDSDHITLWSGQQIHVLSAQDLMDVIRNKTPDSIDHSYEKGDSK